MSEWIAASINETAILKLTNALWKILYDLMIVYFVTLAH